MEPHLKPTLHWSEASFAYRRMPHHAPSEPLLVHHPRNPTRSISSNIQCSASLEVHRPGSQAPPQPTPESHHSSAQASSFPSLRLPESRRRQRRPGARRSRTYRGEGSQPVLPPAWGDSIWSYRGVLVIQYIYSKIPGCHCLDGDSSQIWLK